MTTGKKGASGIGKMKLGVKKAGSTLAKKGTRTQSEMIEKAFTAATKRTGTFASKYAK